MHSNLNSLFAGTKQGQYSTASEATGMPHSILPYSFIVERGIRSLRSRYRSIARLIDLSARRRRLGL